MSTQVKVTSPEAPRAKYGTIRDRSYPIRMGKDALEDLDVIRRKLMRDDPRKPISLAASVRRAIAVYAEHLRRIGDEKLNREIERATKATYENPACYVSR